jgi:hypothetical protein
MSTLRLCLLETSIELQTCADELTLFRLRGKLSGIIRTLSGTRQARHDQMSETLPQNGARPEADLCRATFGS